MKKNFIFIFIGFTAAVIVFACKIRLAESDAKAQQLTEHKVVCDSVMGTGASLVYLNTTLQREKFTTVTAPVLMQQPDVKATLVCVTASK